MSPRRQRIVTIVLMGVAGAGKSTVMASLVELLGWPWLEGDALHPPANVEKMAAGMPLSDADRMPWLDAVAGWIGERERERSSSVVTCSALRRDYRDRLRRGHFMPASMLSSQLDALEPLQPDEPGWAVDALGEPAAIARRIVRALRLDPD
jgi:gluconokinase